MAKKLTWTVLPPSPRLMLFLLMVLACPVSQGGSAPATSSAVPGVLLGIFNFEEDEGRKAFLGEQHSDAFLAPFRLACARQQRIWALGVPDAVVCSKLEYVPEAGDGPVHALHLHSTAPIPRQVFATVLSLSPIVPIKPAARKLTQAEVRGIIAAHPTGSVRRAVQKAIANSAVRVLDFDRKHASVYVVKWKRLDDGDMANDVHVVINRIGARFRAAGSFDGHIVQFLDVNKDGRPEVQRSLSCDGICEAVTSMVGQVEDMVSINNH